MLKLFVSFQNRLPDFRNEEGQTMAEYGVVLAVITLVIVATLLLLSGAINTALEEVTSSPGARKVRNAREKREKKVVTM